MLFRHTEGAQKCALLGFYFFSTIWQNRSIWSAIVCRAPRQKFLSVRSISATLAVSSTVATVEDTALVAGIDLTDKNFWRAALQTIADRIDLFCSLVEN